MKRNKLYTVLCIAIFVTTIVACNDYDAVTVEYEQTGDGGETSVTPPDIDSDWELELITNIGQHDKNVFVYKDKKYDKLFTRSLGWNGGDGVQTTLLPDGNTFWTFNDSFYGVVEENRSRPGGKNNFPRNSIMVQTADAVGKPGETEDNLLWYAKYFQTTDPDAPGYYTARTHIRHPQASLPEESIGHIDADYIYWAGDATVTDDGKKLQMLWGAVDNREGNMIRFGTCLATYSLEGRPGDETYMKLLSKDDNFKTDNMAYGSTLWEDEDGHTYLYCNSGTEVLVARSTTHDLTSEWEYYTRGINGEFQWVNNLPDDEEKKRSNILTNGGQCSLPWVFKKGDMYYLIGQSPYFGKAMYIYRSDKPYGPFTDQKVLFVLPNTIDKIGNQFYGKLYMVNLHQSLSREGELVFSTNTDPSNYWDNFNNAGSADYYRPFFYRVFNWESVY